MFSNLTIKARLVFLIIFLCAVSIVICAIGLFNLNVSNASLKTVYEDRVVPLEDLGVVHSLMNQNQLTIANALTGDPQKFGAAADDVAKRIERITAMWEKYMATFLTPEEKALAQRFIDSRGKFVAGGLKPALAALRAQDQKAAVDIVQGPMTPLYQAAEKDLEAIVDLQLAVAKNEYDEGLARYERARGISIAAVVIAVLMAAAIGTWLVRGIAASLKEALQVTQSIAQGDLSRKVEVRSRDEIGQLLLALRAMSENLAGIVRQVRSGTDTIATASSQIASGNLDLSSRTEEQASALEETASSMEELTSTVRHNADNATQANQLATSASGIAEKGGNVVDQVVDTMSAIDASSKKIVDIISVIDGIAFQTNILALNAAVEAARAGEQGRGFAVVASEVRSLAQRSAAAAKEIKTLIGDSVDKVALGTQLVGEAGTTMRDIVGSVRRVTDIMDEIASASREQGVGIEQVNQAVGQMDQVTQQNAALVEEAAAAAASLQEQATNLAQVVSVFKL